MSTSYYNLAHPFGSIRVEDHDLHARINLFDIQLAHMGELVFRKDRVKYTDFLYMIRERDPAVVQVGVGGGKVEYIQHKEITSAVLISEYQEVIRSDDMRQQMEGITKWEAYTV